MSQVSRAINSRQCVYLVHDVHTMQCTEKPALSPSLHISWQCRPTPRTCGQRPPQRAAAASFRTKWLAQCMGSYCKSPRFESVGSTSAKWHRGAAETCSQRGDQIRAYSCTEQTIICAVFMLVNRLFCPQEARTSLLAEEENRA
jgi:hypothetical protein